MQRVLRNLTRLTILGQKMALSPRVTKAEQKNYLLHNRALIYVYF